MSILDPAFVIDPFTFAALIGIAAWLNRRLARVEQQVAFAAGFKAGQISLNPPPSKQKAIEE